MNTTKTAQAAKSLFRLSKTATYGELKKLLPGTGTARVPGIRKLRSTATVVLQSKTDNGIIEVYNNGFYTYMENARITVYAVDRCSVLEWHSGTGETLSSKTADLSDLPWAIPLEIAGFNRLDHNGGSRQERWTVYSLDEPASENNIKFSVRPEHERNEEAEEEQLYRNMRADLVRQAIMHLTPRQRDVLLFIHVEKLTQDKVAERMGITRMAVRTHLERAEKKFKKFFKSCSHFDPQNLD